MRMAWITTSDPSTRDRDNLEHVRGTVRAQVQHLGVVLLADHECMVDRVQDVRIRDPLPPGGPVDLHVPNIVSRNSGASPSRFSCARSARGAVVL